MKIGDLFVLSNVYADDVNGTPQLNVQVDADTLAVGIQIGGYGDACGADIPVIVENRNGVPYVIVWADINSDEPTHEISLANAADAMRMDDGNEKTA